MTLVKRIEDFRKKYDNSKYEGIIPDKDLESFISQVEKEAIEKTNKRWREKYLGWEKEVLKLTTDKQYLKALADVKSYGLSDLLEDKK